MSLLYLGVIPLILLATACAGLSVWSVRIWRKGEVSAGGFLLMQAVSFSYVLTVVVMTVGWILFVHMIAAG